MSLLPRQGHAWLLQGPSGLGQYDLALALVRHWLCESPTATGACGACPSCHAIDVRAHADVCVLMPEVQMIELGWPLSEKAQSEIDDKKRKPSLEIRVDAMRDAIEFSQRTSARGRGKAVLIFPAEQMNAVTANALLKTLEEPPGDVKFVLASESAHQLLPTIRSRCQVHSMVWPDAASALQWLASQGMPAKDASVLLRAAGGRPDDVRLWINAGRTAGDWAQFPGAMERGDASFVRDWSAPQLIDALQKLCHDAVAANQGATTRFFEAGSLAVSTRARLLNLTEWGAKLAQARRTADHPFNLGLLQEALVSQAQSALNSGNTNKL
jgi:DNA polymerase-3 subunit delta'